MSDRSDRRDHPHDQTISQRRAALRLTFWLIVIGAFFALVARSHGAELMPLAEANLNEVDAGFLKSWIVVALVLVGVVVQIMNARRKPSFDVDLASHEGDARLIKSKIESLEGQNRLIFKKLDAITDTLSMLKSQQGINSEAVKHIETSMKGIADQVQALVENELAAIRRKA